MCVPNLNEICEIVELLGTQVKMYGRSGATEMELVYPLPPPPALFGDIIQSEIVVTKFCLLSRLLLYS